MSRTVNQMLDSVERLYAGAYWMIRETESLVDGRIDGILIAESHEAGIMKKLGRSRIGGGFLTGYQRAANVTGLEVKASRADFLRGLREKQFDRYAETLSGLIVVTMRDVKTTEIPAACGHIAIHHGTGERWKAVCKRQPNWVDRPLTAVQAIEVMHRFKQRKDEQIRLMELAYREKLKRIGTLASKRIFKVIEGIEQEATKHNGGGANG